MPRKDTESISQLLDNAPINRLHMKIWFTCAMGVFLDGFDFFIIGLAYPLISQDMGLSDPFLEGVVVAAAIVGAMVGASTLGPLTDRMGRKKVYVVNLVAFVVFALFSALSWDVWSLLVSRFLLGLGIGAEYPISASFISEIVPSRRRGSMLIGCFAFQALGMLFGALAGLVVLEVYPQTHAWRWMLALGMVPAILVSFLRLTAPESPRWLISRGRVEEASAILSELLGREVSPEQARSIETTTRPPRYAELFAPQNRRRLVLATVPWFLMDIATYGVGLFTPIILAAMAFGGKGSLVATELASVEGAAFLDVFLVVGFLLAMRYIDRLGRIPLQLAGFASMAAGLFVLAWTTTAPGGSQAHLPMVFFGFILFNLMMNAGPNSTTYVLPAEIFETGIRASAHGLASASAKFGAAVGVFFFPVLRDMLGMTATLVAVGCICLLAMAVTYVFRVETKGVSLAEAGTQPEAQPLTTP